MVQTQAATLWGDLGATLAHNTGDGQDISGGAVKRDDTATNVLYFKFHVDPLSDVSTEEYFAGFELFEGEARRLAIGNANKAWAYSAFHTAEIGGSNRVAGDFDLRSGRPESSALGVFKTYELPRRGNERTIVFKVQYVPGDDDLVTAWLNPDLAPGATEAGQPESVTTRFKADCSFDEIHLRHGGGGGGWVFSDMAIATEFNDFVAAGSLESGSANPLAGGGAQARSFRAWQREQGLPQNFVRALAQTRDGYLWLGTDVGIARFDGVRFVSFGEREGLQSGPVRRLFEDSRGALWIGSVNGGLTRWQGGEFTTFTTKDGLPANSITALAEDAEGRLWVGTDSGLSVRQNERWVPLSGADVLQGNAITGLFKNKKGTMWVAAKNAGIFQFQKGTLSALTDDSVDKLLRDPHCLLVDQSERLWVGAGDDFVLCLDAGNWRRYRIPRHLDKPFINALAELPDGTVWAGSVSEGLFQFRDGKLVAVNAGNGLLDNVVESLLADGDGNLWVGTGAGLNQLRPRSVSFFGPTEGLGYGSVNGLAEVAPGVIWVGKSGDGLYRGQGRGFSRLALAGLARNDAQVNAILPARDGSCWVASGQGLLHVEKPNDDALSSQPTVMVEVNAIALAEDRDGVVWAGTREGEIWRLQAGQRAAATNYWQAHPVTAIVRGVDGSMWIGTEGGGLQRFHDGVRTHYGKTNGLLSDSIRTLHQDGRGVLWIGTAGGGLARWANGRVSAFSMREGMPDDTVSQILEDNDQLWLGTKRGIACISKAELKAMAEGKSTGLYPRTFGRDDGMLSEECTGGFGPAGLRTKSGLLWFSTQKGVAVVNPRLKHDGSQTAPVIIEEVVIDDVAVAAFPTSRSPSQGRESQAGQGNFQLATLRIPPGKHRIELRYTGLSFNAPERMRFRYRLEGLDSDWVEAGTRRTAFYSYVPPGEHRFQVITCDNDGVWNKSGATLSLTVQPYFWQTWWFASLAVIAIFISVGGGIRFVEKRKIQAQMRNLERERALEKERARIAQDLHDDLGASLSRISLLSDMAKAKPVGNSNAEVHVKKISELAGQTLRALDEIVWAVRPGSDSVQSLVEYIAHFANELFKGNGVRCRLDLPDNLPALSLPPEMRHNIFLIAKEALTNAMRHASAREVCVQIKTADDALDLVIKDDGRGFDAVSPQSSVDGNGLANMHHRAEAIGGKLELQSAVGKGTVVRLQVGLARNGTAAKLN